MKKLPQVGQVPAGAMSSGRESPETLNTTAGFRSGQESSRRLASIIFPPRPTAGIKRTTLSNQTKRHILAAKAAQHAKNAGRHRVPRRAAPRAVGSSTVAALTQLKMKIESMMSQGRQPVHFIHR